MGWWGRGISAGWKWNLASIKKKKKKERQKGTGGGHCVYEPTLFNLQARRILMTTKCLELAPAPGLSLFHSRVITNAILVQVQMYSAWVFYNFPWGGEREGGEWWESINFSYVVASKCIIIFYCLGKCYRVRLICICKREIDGNF